MTTNTEKATEYLSYAYPELEVEAIELAKTSTSPAWDAISTARPAKRLK